ncbi:RibD family protein [Clostridium oceanicum]|uniref:Dihydrofolate reductase family protein n=1 Tax=Clostridium oceanicum TaxID=1543 RepID=A0ABN1J816_9CLOT
MPSNLPKKSFDYDNMKAKELYFNKNINLCTEGVIHENVRKVFGRDLMFGEIPKNRPYTFNSLVTSIDGKIAFEDDPKGPLIARKNKYAGKGADLDYWLLNVLRGAADAILVGTNSIAAEATSGGTGHCYDNHIEKRREEIGIDPIPWRIVVTLDGKDICFSAAQFTNKDMSTFFYTTEEGIDSIKKNIKKEVEVIGPFSSIDNIKINNFKYDSKKAYIIVTNRERKFDHKIGMKILREMGIKRLLVESPTVTHYFMEEKLLDELFLNYSCLYIGGKALSMGSNNTSFTSSNHPHSKLISLHMHSPSFLYLRHKLLY